jgi:hypothetical protein
MNALEVTHWRPRDDTFVRFAANPERLPTWPALTSYETRLSTVCFLQIYRDQVHQEIPEKVSGISLEGPLNAGS